MEIKINYKDPIKEFDSNINEVLKSKMNEVNKLILHDENEIIIRILLNRIHKANKIIKKQKNKMYKCNNKIAVYILNDLQFILKGVDNK